MAQLAKYISAGVAITIPVNNKVTTVRDKKVQAEIKPETDAAVEFLGKLMTLCDEYGYPLNISTGYPLDACSCSFYSEEAKNDLQNMCP